MACKVILTLLKAMLHLKISCQGTFWLLWSISLSQVIGVAAAVVGDMSGRPHWGLYELDFVFSTLIVRAPLMLS